jgi:hypothetical protein
MSINSGINGRPGSEIPPDDLQRVLTLAQPDKNQSLPHLGIVGDTYTIVLTGDAVVCDEGETIEAPGQPAPPGIHSGLTNLRACHDINNIHYHTRNH